MNEIEIEVPCKLLVVEDARTQTSFAVEICLN